jgi:hypothetical protein
MTGISDDQDWDAYPPGAVPVAYPPAAAQGPPPGYGPPYGPPPGYGPAYWPPGYGYPYAYPPLTPPAWPHGPGRPGVATTAAVLGFVTAGLTLLVSAAMLLAVLSGEDDVVTLLLTLGWPCAAGLIVGGVRLQRRRSPAALFGAAIASVAVLVLAWLAGAVTIDRTDGMDGLTVFVFAALVLPVLTAVFAWIPVVRSWAAARED